VYSFAMILFELHTGRYPWSSDTTQVMLINYVAIQGKRPELPPSLPASRRALITSCWQQEPQDRPPMTTVLSQLDPVK
jgi:serine/threonine protein kinase